jgi:hypothetical protein
MARYPKQSKRALIAMVTGLLLSGRTAQGQPVDAFNELEGRLTPGVTVSVIDESGRATRGLLTGISPSSLSLLVDGEPRAFDGAHVRRIERLVPDRVINGTLWGLAAGVGAGFLGMLAVRNAVKLDDAGVVVAVALIGCPVAGAVVGAQVDAATPTRELVYARSGAISKLGPSPHRVGLAVAVRF